MPDKKVTRNSSVVATSAQVSTDLAGKTAILGLKSRTYYTLDEVGAPIWESIKQEREVEQLLQTMLRKYDVEPQQCEQDLLIFLQNLADLDLIEVK